MMIDPYQWRTATIADIKHESPNAVSVCLDLPNYRYQSGQHAIVRIVSPDGTRHIRQYSFASAPVQPLQLTVVRTPGGEVSTWFNDYAKAGDIIELSQPFAGPLVVDPTAYRCCVMIAGGSGIVPMMSHIRTQRSHASEVPTVLLYSTRHNSLCYQPELIPKNNETIIIRETDSQPRFASHDILPHLYDDSLVMICGSRPFVVAMRAIAAQQAPSATIVAEAFSL